MAGNVLLSNPILQGGGAGGSGALTLGPPTNTFSGGSLAAAHRARNTYATANPTWLAQYDAQPTYAIAVTDTSGPTTMYEARRGGAWVTVTPIIRGPRGDTGSRGPTGADGPRGPAGPMGSEGARGFQGVQGNGYQVVHQVTNSATGPTAPAGDLLGAWSDDPPDIDETNQYLWAADRIGYTGTWSAWNVFLVGRYGVDGADGTGGGGASLSSAAPADVSTTAAAGSSTSASRSDHVHDIADDAVGTDQLAADSVTDDILGPNAVHPGHISSDAVETSKIRDAAVTEAKLAAAVIAKLHDDESIQDVIGAMVSGNTETGIRVTYDDATGKINFIVTGGGGQSPSTHQRYGAFKFYARTANAPTFVEADYTGGVSSTSESVVLSGAVDAADRRFAISFWSAQQLTFITSENTAPRDDNVLLDFTEGRLTIASVNGYTYIESGLLEAAQINTTWTVR